MSLVELVRPGSESTTYLSWGSITIDTLQLSFEVRSTTVVSDPVNTTVRNDAGGSEPFANATVANSAPYDP